MCFSRSNLSRIKHEAYVINLVDKPSEATRWVSLFFDLMILRLFGIEYTTQEVLSNFKDTSIMRNLFRIKSNNSIMYGFYCITFKEYMISGKTLLDYTNFFLLATIKRMAR